MRNLIARGDLEDFSINGFFNRYKLHFKLDTPDFMIDSNLTFYEKMFLYKLRTLVPMDMEKVSNKYLQAIFSPNNKTHIVTNFIYKCKHKLGLDNLLPYARNASILSIDLLEVYTDLQLLENGFQKVINTTNICTRCGKVYKDKFHYRRTICDECYKKRKEST